MSRSLIFFLSLGIFFRKPHSLEILLKVFNGTILQTCKQERVFKRFLDRFLINQEENREEIFLTALRHRGEAYFFSHPVIAEVTVSSTVCRFFPLFPQVVCQTIPFAAFQCEFLEYQSRPLIKDLRSYQIRLQAED